MLIPKRKCLLGADWIRCEESGTPKWRHQMETFSALLAISAGNSPVPGEFPTQRPVTLSFDVFFDLRLNKRLSKQLWGWWFESQSSSLWRNRDAFNYNICTRCSSRYCGLVYHVPMNGITMRCTLCHQHILIINCMPVTSVHPNWSTLVKTPWRLIISYHIPWFPDLYSVTYRSHG